MRPSLTAEPSLNIVYDVDGACAVEYEPAVTSQKFGVS